MLLLADALLSAEESQSISHEQLISSSDSQSGQRVQKGSLTGFLPILHSEAWWENTEISQYSQTVYLSNSCLWVLWKFFQIEHKKVIGFYPKVTNCSFNPELHQSCLDIFSLPHTQWVTQVGMKRQAHVHTHVCDLSRVCCAPELTPRIHVTEC